MKDYPAYVKLPEDDLGCVDISSEPYESTDEVQESQETR